MKVFQSTYSASKPWDGPEGPIQRPSLTAGREDSGGTSLPHPHPQGLRWSFQA